eukprot:scaffold5556_cov20-Tisochrysis_lutea.AAC.1
MHGTYMLTISITTIWRQQSAALMSGMMWRWCGDGEESQTLMMHATTQRPALDKPCPLCRPVQVLSDINSTPLPLQSSSATPLLPQLLYDHLMHHRYWRTAAAIKQDLLQASVSGAEAAQCVCTSCLHPVCCM